MSWSWRRMWRDARIPSVMGMPSITNAQPVVRLRDVTRTYGQVVALAGISLDIHRGRFTAIMGPSGSGKSTLMNVAAGLDDATSGEVLLAGANLRAMDERTDSTLSCSPSISLVLRTSSVRAAKLASSSSRARARSTSTTRMTRFSVAWPLSSRARASSA